VPELPDLEVIVERLAPLLAGRRIREVTVKEPVVIRMLLPGPGGTPVSFADALAGREFVSLRRHGPFLDFGLGAARLVIHCMLSGSLQLAPAAAKLPPHACFSLALDDGSRFTYFDDTRMGKVYACAPGQTAAIPGFDTQGVDILSEAFSWDRFQELIRGRRQQARVFLMDQAALSAIGNAYADEILFAAGIHPKTTCASLDAVEKRRLYDAVRSVMAWGIDEVRKAGQPLEVKVRGHVKVRNRKDEPCPACGTKIRRAGVLGYDSFFCPSCQPAKRPQKIPW
jgi:formamidopyrimidine-DNA glycosylase